MTGKNKYNDIEIDNFTISKQDKRYYKLASIGFLLAFIYSIFTSIVVFLPHIHSKFFNYILLSTSCIILLYHISIGKNNHSLLYSKYREFIFIPMQGIIFYSMLYLGFKFIIK
ncbi:MAG: hypothetical protein PHI97_29050 [Desulfobulbus sp.]|nr:hypothetical protein [Desulfobulbus sp.]